MQWILGFILILSSLGVITAKKPIYSSLSFLLALLTLATFYIQLSAEFVAVMQILVYAGAILVIFMFVIVLFQDAHAQIEKMEAKSATLLLASSLGVILIVLLFLAKQFIGFIEPKHIVNPEFGTVQSLGKLLYTDFFFPFEAVILVFLVAVISALYIAKKEV